MTQTAMNAKAMDRNGKMYQRRAVHLLPILVRQAEARSTILCSDLAHEIGIANERTLNWPLGAVGISLIELGRRWGQTIPRIQALVNSREERLPGREFMEAFLDPAILESADRQLRKKAVEAMLADVFAYPRWHDVLAQFGLRHLPRVSDALLGAACVIRAVKATPTEISNRTSLPIQSASASPRESSRRQLSMGCRAATGLTYEAVIDAIGRAQGVQRDVAVLSVLEGAASPAVRMLATSLGVEIR